MEPILGTWPATVKDYGLGVIGTDAAEKEYAFIDVAVHFNAIDPENPLGDPEPYDHSFRWTGWLHTEAGRKVAFGGLKAAGLRKLEDLPKMADGVASKALDPSAKIVVSIVPDDYKGEGHYKIGFINDADAPPPTKRLSKAEASKRLMESGALGELGLFFTQHPGGTVKAALVEKPKLPVDKIDL